MDQKKIGLFLKKLRNEKGLTQEQFAEEFLVSNRTVSRWETGNNMPGLDVLIDVADFYNIDIREILDGERKSEYMDSELRETVLKVADYDNEAKIKMTRRLNAFFIVAIVAMILHFAIIFLFDNIESNLLDFIKGFTLGMPLAVLIVGAIYISRYSDKFAEFKNKRNNNK